MNRNAYITLDLEPDYAGRIQPQLCSWKKRQIRELLDLLKKYHVKLTVFVVANLLESNNETVGMLQKFGAEFHLLDKPVWRDVGALQPDVQATRH